MSKEQGTRNKEQGTGEGVNIEQGMMKVEVWMTSAQLSALSASAVNKISGKH
ncbi:MAG: hypothetical protein HYU71_04205 [Bacteroidetes bacterium]|nr:hypothetical protein [Bacteroidota bacterium]